MQGKELADDFAVNRHTGGLEKSHPKIKGVRYVNRHTGGLEIILV